ncbi:hypothetical protein [Methanococcoides sp. AM1]|uniref:hypothetical protein n=1 Tax=Methanococcoides sp. AM1 TaxID=1201011 RepID=UPI00143849FB|nr:hypothetical protein [Methanococcoides sp. AM1]
MSTNCCDVCKVYEECSKLGLKETVNDLKDKKLAACLYACELQYRKVIDGE